MERSFLNVIEKRHLANSEAEKSINLLAKSYSSLEIPTPSKILNEAIIFEFLSVYNYLNISIIDFIIPPIMPLIPKIMARAMRIAQIIQVATPPSKPFSNS